nr:hypothetical protein [Pandoravirus massiliensis]
MQSGPNARKFQIPERRHDGGRDDANLPHGLRRPVSVPVDVVCSLETAATCLFVGPSIARCMHKRTSQRAERILGQLGTPCRGHGAVYTPMILINAVRQGSQRIVALLCERYGTHDTQAAVDAWVAGRNERYGVDWIVDNVPGIDTTNVACALKMTEKPKDPYLKDNCMLM